MNANGRSCDDIALCIMFDEMVISLSYRGFDKASCVAQKNYDVSGVKNKKVLYYYRFILNVD